MAAYILAIVYYYSRDLDSAVPHTLAAIDSLFTDQTATDRGLIGEVLTRYLATRDATLQPVFDRMFSISLAAGEHHSCIGLAVEAHRIDLLQAAFDALTKPDESLHAIQFAFEHARQVADKAEREVLLHSIYKSFVTRVPGTSIADRIQLLILVDDAKLIADEIANLVDAEPVRAVAVTYDIVTMADDAQLKFIHTYFVEKHKEGTEAKFITEILTGQPTRDIVHDYLTTCCDVDANIFKRLHKSVPKMRNMFQSALLIGNTFHCLGTKNDSYLRDNLGWLGGIKHRAMFTAIASIGAIHQGSVDRAVGILTAHLPSPGEAIQPDKEFSNGGAMMGLGMIAVGQPRDELHALFINTIHNCAGNTTVLQGACFGLGLMHLRSNDGSTAEVLAETLMHDDADVGEAAAIGIGMVMMGSGNTKYVNQLIEYATNTSHSKISRACGMGLALLLYNRRQEAEESVAVLIDSTQALLREGGAQALGMAYAGSADLNVAGRLLHLAVADTSDDVRRAAVTAIAFVTPRAKLCDMLGLMARSYNPHTRAGTATALGLNLAGTNDPEAIKILGLLAADQHDFVRQAALLSQALVMSQAPTRDTRAAEQTMKLVDIASDSYEQKLTRYGAIVSAGIMAAGGHNLTFSLYDESGLLRPAAFAAGLLYAQFPENHLNLLFLSLGMAPRMVCAVTPEGTTVEGAAIKVAVNPKDIAYPAHIEVEKKKSLRKRGRTQLSVQRTDTKKEEEVEGMPEPAEEADVDMAAAPTPTHTTLDMPTRVHPMVKEGEIGAEGRVVVEGLTPFGVVVMKKDEILE